MGTTVTTNLGLIKPDGSESIKENLPTFAGWAAQNGLNCDTIDGLFRSSSHTWTVNWTASTVNPTLGSTGFTEGKYIRLFPRMVLAHFRIYTGLAGFAAGTGSYNINLPTTVPAEFATFADSAELPLGKAIFLDNSAVLTSSIFTPMYNKTSNLLFFRDPSANTWTNALPVAMGQDDRLSGYVLYPTSAA